MSDNNRRSWQQWLDGIDTAASMLYILLAAVVVGAILGLLFYVVSNWPEGYGIGPQGEGVYLAIAFLLVIGWVMGQLAWFKRRRRRSAWTFKDGSEIPLPKISAGESGISIQWGQPPDPSHPAQGSKTWTIPIVSNEPRTFSLDRAALDAARSAREAGASWTEVCRQVNPEFDSLNALDRALYQRAVEAAVKALHERGDRST